MTELAPWKVEIFVKIAALFLAAFGIYEYFDTERKTVERAKQQAALSYIAESNATEHQSAVQTTFEFWLRNPDVVSLLRSSGQTSTGLQAFFVTAVHGDPNGNEVVFAVRQIGRFFDEVSACASNSVCDRGVLEDFFCDDAKRLTMIYDPIFEVLREQSGEQQLGQGLVQFARECESAP